MFGKCAKNFECLSHRRAVLGHLVKNTKLDFCINFMLWPRNFLWNIQMFKYSRGTFSMISTHKKFFSVFEIFHTKLSKKNVLGIRNVTFWLFFNNKHLRFCCQIITYGHHLSKKIITSQFSQFSFLPQFDVLGHISATWHKIKKS